MRNGSHITEPARDLPVVEHYDVLVAGGGMAGVAAAVAAARNGVRVGLLEKESALGGLATLGNVTIWLPLCDGMGNQVIGGMGEELLRLAVANLRKENPTASFNDMPQCWRENGDPDERRKKRFLARFNPSEYMLELERLIIDTGVELLYDTRVCALHHDGDAVSHLVVENKSGRQAIGCRTLVDATGDADICHLAGEKTESLDTNVLCGWFYILRDGKLHLHSYTNPYSPDTDRQGAVGPFFRGDEGAEVTAHIVGTRAEVRKRLGEIRARYPDKTVEIINPATIACMRMTRRLAGEYTLTEADQGKWFADTIGLTGDWRKAGPVYALPLRSICGVNNSNLLVAGRCISSAGSAWDVTRAIPGCVVTGQAAGTAAALAAESAKSDVRELDVSRLQKKLVEQGVILAEELVAGKVVITGE